MAVARSRTGNHREAIVVVAPMMKGWAAARPTWEMKTRVKFEAKMPRASPKTAVMTAPRPTDARKPFLSINQAAG